MFMLNQNYFLENKYTNWYISIITNAQKLNRKKEKYYESHHILPKSLSPEYSDLRKHKWNKVVLTPKEHFICHLLLTKMVTGKFKSKMCYALWGMVNQKSKYQDERYVCSSRLYSYAKTLSAKHLSAERKGKTFEELYGNIKAQEIKNKFKTRRTRGPNSIEERENTSKRITELSQIKPWKRNFENRNQPKKECPYCSKIMDIGNFTRHHGDNCKLKPGWRKDAAAC